MQDASQQMDDLIRQVKNGSAFESLAAAEKLAELSRARRRTDGTAREGAERIRSAAESGSKRDGKVAFLRLMTSLSQLIAEWSEDPEALQNLQHYLNTQSSKIDGILASKQSIAKTAG
ncbi:MAG TPA: hypothetical protein VN380_09210 [Thermoanaerobaculia bacterium]|jgi:hypothetical protein|nr:hypothetical protein [Thermoanaerobaculia bacterium]